MKKIAIIFLLLAGGVLFGQTAREIYTATLPNGTTWIGQKSPEMPVGAKRLSGKDSLEVVAPEESNRDRFLRKTGVPMHGLSENGKVYLTGTWQGSAELAARYADEYKVREERLREEKEREREIRAIESKQTVEKKEKEQKALQSKTKHEKEVQDIGGVIIKKIGDSCPISFDGEDLELPCYEFAYYKFESYESLRANPWETVDSIRMESHLRKVVSDQHALIYTRKNKFTSAGSFSTMGFSLGNKEVSLSNGFTAQYPVFIESE